MHHAVYYRCFFPGNTWEAQPPPLTLSLFLSEFSWFILFLKLLLPLLPEALISRSAINSTQLSHMYYFLHHFQSSISWTMPPCHWHEGSSSFLALCYLYQFRRPGSHSPALRLVVTPATCQASRGFWQAWCLRSSFPLAGLRSSALILLSHKTDCDLWCLLSMWLILETFLVSNCGKCILSRPRIFWEVSVLFQLRVFYCSEMVTRWSSCFISPILLSECLLVAHLSLITVSWPMKSQVQIRETKCIWFLIL